MSPVTSETRVEWSSRLAEALVQGGYDTQANLAPLVAEAQATGEPLAMLLISRNLALPGVVVGALAHLAKMQAIDLAAVVPSPDAVRPCLTTLLGSTELWPCSSTGLYWPWPSPSRRPRGCRRVGLARWDIASIPCWPTRSSSARCSSTFTTVPSAPDLLRTSPLVDLGAGRQSIVGKPGFGG
jgi:hypothetical protein